MTKYIHKVANNLKQFYTNTHRILYVIYLETLNSINTTTTTTTPHTHKHTHTPCLVLWKSLTNTEPNIWEESIPPRGYLDEPGMNGTGFTAFLVLSEACHVSSSLLSENQS